MNACGASFASICTTSSKISSPSDGFVPEQSSSRITIAPGRQALEELADAEQLRPEAALGLIGLRLLDERHDEPRSERERARARGHEEARLREQLREAERLQEARLAARVRAGDEHGRVVAIDVEVARHGLHAVREEERIEEPEQRARLSGRHELRQATPRGPPRARCRGTRARRGRIRGRRASCTKGTSSSWSPSKTASMRRAITSPSLNLKPRTKSSIFAEPASPRRAHERVLLVLLDREDLEAADAAVGADADLQVQRREPLVVAEEIGERAIRLALLHPAPERREPRRGPERAVTKPSAAQSMISFTSWRMSSCRRFASHLPTPVAPSSSVRNRQSVR